MSEDYNATDRRFAHAERRRSRIAADDIAEPAVPVWESKSRRPQRVFAALDDLWRATRSCRGAGTDLNDALRPSLRPVVDEARTAGLLAEQLLRLMKESWRAFPKKVGEDREEAKVQLDGLITLCIEEFYREQ